MPSRDICSLCHALANQHRYNLSHDSLFCEETNDTKEDAEDTLVYDPDDDILTVIDSSKDDSGSNDENINVEEPSRPPPNHVPAGSSEVETREQMLLRAAWHVKSACCQRSLYKCLVEKSRTHAKNNVCHSHRSYTFVVDYGQNMEMPSFGGNQPGDTYYFTPLSVYNLGVVNCAHIHSGETEPKDHMHCHLYHEGIASKGANNVASLILKTLTEIGVMREEEKGGELNIVFDNCSGQNKNNTVLRLAPYLVEMGYFKAVNFVFLVVGHTKNSADMLFNVLKKSTGREILIPWKNCLKI